MRVQFRKDVVTKRIEKHNRWLYSPESLGLMVDGPPEAARLCVVNRWNNLRVFHLVGTGSKLYSDWLSSTWRLLPVQVFNSFLCLCSFVKSNESHTTRESCNKNRLSAFKCIPGHSRCERHNYAHLPTWCLIDENTGVDYFAITRKHFFDVLLRHCFRQPADVKIGILYGVRAWPGIWHLSERAKLKYQILKKSLPWREII